MKRELLAKAYVRALPVCSVVILASEDGRSAKASLDPEPDNAPFSLFDTLWFAKSQYAELVLAQCPEGWCGRAPAALRDEIVNAAAALGASFKTSAEIEADASNAVAEIIERVDAMRQSGGLAKVNAGYKCYRKAQVAAGQKAVSYQAHLDAFTLSLVRLAAQNAAAV